MIQIMIKQYKKAEDYQHDVALQSALGWYPVDTAGLDKHRFSNKQKLVVTYSQDTDNIPELPVMPDGLGYWARQKWYRQNEPAGIGAGWASTQWRMLVLKHTKEVQG